jgi:hypothetical protein
MADILPAKAWQALAFGRQAAAGEAAARAQAEHRQAKKRKELLPPGAA